MAGAGRCAAFAAVLSQRLAPRFYAKCSPSAALWDCAPEWPPVFDVAEGQAMPPPAGLATLVPSRTVATDRAHAVHSAWAGEGHRVLGDARRIAADIAALKASPDPYKSRYWYRHELRLGSYRIPGALSWDGVVLSGYMPQTAYGCQAQLDTAGESYGAALRCGDWCALLPAGCGPAAPPAEPPPAVPPAREACGDWVTSAVALQWTEHEHWAVSCGGAEPCCTVKGGCLSPPPPAADKSRVLWCWAYPKWFGTKMHATGDWDLKGGIFSEWRGEFHNHLLDAPHFSEIRHKTAPKFIMGRTAGTREGVDWPLLEWRGSGRPRWTVCLDDSGQAATPAPGEQCAVPEPPPAAPPNSSIAAVGSMALSGLPLPPHPPPPPPPPAPLPPAPTPGEARPLVLEYQDWAGTQWGYDGEVCGRLDPITDAAVAPAAWCAVRRSGRVEGCWAAGGGEIGVAPAARRLGGAEVIGVKRGNTFAAVAGGRVAGWWGTAFGGTGELPAEVAAARAAAISVTDDSLAVISGAGRIAAAWGEARSGGALPLAAHMLHDVAAVAANAQAFAALLSNGTIGGAWGLWTYGGILPPRMRCVSGVAAVMTTHAAFSALRSNGTVAGGWGVVFDVPQLGNVAAVVPNERAFAALSTDGRVLDQWGDDNEKDWPLPAIVAAARGIASLTASGDWFAILLHNGRLGGLWRRDVWQFPPEKRSPSTALAVGSQGGVLYVSSQGAAIWQAHHGSGAALPSDQRERLEAAPVAAVRARRWGQLVVALRASGSVAAAWYEGGKDVMGRPLALPKSLSAFPEDGSARFRLLGEPCAAPPPVAGADTRGCSCLPPGRECTVYRDPAWYPLRQDEWDDAGLSRVTLHCPADNTRLWRPASRRNGSDYAGLSLAPNNCSGGPQWGVDDRVLSYEPCSALHSGERCAPRCAAGWQAVNASVSVGDAAAPASFELVCLPYVTTEGVAFRYDASAVRCERERNASAWRPLSRPGFEAIGLPLRPDLAFEAVASDGTRLPSPPAADCLLCDCSQPNASVANRSGGPCGSCEVLYNASAEYDRDYRGACQLLAAGVAEGSYYAELVAVAAFRPLPESEHAAFGLLPDLAVRVLPGGECSRAQVLQLRTGSTRCRDCPPNLLCDGSNATGVRKGWWRPDKLALNASKCVTPHCSGAAPARAEPACAKGSGGPLCGTCSEGYRIAGGACRPCAAPWVSVLATAGGLILGLLVAVAYLFVNAAVWLEETPFRDLLQITLTHVQFLTLLPYFLGPIYGAVVNALLGGLRRAMAPLAAAAPLLCLLPSSAGQLEVAWAAAALLWIAPLLAGGLAVVALPPLLHRRLQWRLRRARAAGGGRVAGAECARCGALGERGGCGCGALPPCPCGAEWATHSCSRCGGPWLCASCAAGCAADHNDAVVAAFLCRTGPVLLPPRTLFWLGVNLATHFLLPHCVSAIAGGFLRAPYDERAAEGWLRRRVVLAADGRVAHEVGGAVFTTHAVLLAAAVVPMASVYWRLRRLARRGALGSAHAVVAYGIFYLPYRRGLYLWGVVPFVTKVVAAAASTMIEAAVNKAAFGTMLHSLQVLVMLLFRPEPDLYLTWVTSGTVLATVSGGRWLLMRGTAADAVIVRVGIAAVNLWCFSVLFNELRKVAPDCAHRRYLGTSAAPAAAGANAKAASSSPGPPAAAVPAAPVSPLRRLLRSRPRAALPATAATLCRRAGGLPPRQGRALRAAAAALLRGAAAAAARPQQLPQPRAQSAAAEGVGDLEVFLVDVADGYEIFSVEPPAPPLSRSRRAQAGATPLPPPLPPQGSGGRTGQPPRGAEAPELRRARSQQLPQGAPAAPAAAPQQPLAGPAAGGALLARAASQQLALGAGAAPPQLARFATPPPQSLQGPRRRGPPALPRCATPPPLGLQPPAAAGASLQVQPAVAPPRRQMQQRPGRRRPEQHTPEVEVLQLEDDPPGSSAGDLPLAD